MKVLGIGLGRTGTMSLALALDKLGFRTRHCPDFFLGKDGNLIIQAEQVEAFDALTDEPTILIYKKVDQEHPGSKFIHTIRDVKTWLKSIVNNGESLREVRSQDPSVPILHEALYGSAVFDPQIYAEAYSRHIAKVKEYFVDRPNDLLVMNICDGEGWGMLCSFLKKPTPKELFPRSNVFGESDLHTVMEKRKAGIEVPSDSDPSMWRIHAHLPGERHGT